MVTTWEECNQALRDMAEIDQKVAQSALDRDTAKREAQEAYDAETGDDLKLRGELAAAVEKFAKRKRKEICAEGRKSRELNFGEIAFKKGRESLAFMKGYDEAKTLEAIKANLKGALKKALVRTKVSLDKTAAKRLDGETLQTIGLAIAEGEETISIKTFPERLQS